MLESQSQGILNDPRIEAKGSGASRHCNQKTIT
jgi:hypothetical protein